MIFIEPICKEDQHYTLNCSLIRRVIKTLDLDEYEIYVHKSSEKYYKKIFKNVYLIENVCLTKNKKVIYLSTDLKTLSKGVFRKNNVFIIHGILEIFNEIKTIKRFFHVIIFTLLMLLNRIKKNNLVIVGDHIVESIKSNFFLKNINFNLINLCFEKSIFKKIYKPEKSDKNIIVLGNYHKGKWWLSNTQLENINYYGKVHSGREDLSFLILNEGYLTLNKYYSLLTNCKALLILNKSYLFTSSYVLIEAIFLNKKIISFENYQSIFLKKIGVNILTFKNEKELLSILESYKNLNVDYNNFIKKYNNQILKGIKEVLC